MLQPDFGQNVFLVHCLSELIGRDEFLVQKECLDGCVLVQRMGSYGCGGVYSSLFYTATGAQDGISKETSESVATSEVYSVLRSTEVSMVATSSTWRSQICPL